MTEKEKIKEVIERLIFDNMRLKIELQNKAEIGYLEDSETNRILDLLARNDKMIELLKKELR